MKRLWMCAVLAALLIGYPGAVLSECIQGDCLNGEGVMTYPGHKNFKKYTGQFKDGVPEGQGMMIGAGGDTYTGSWQKGKPDGRGILTYPEGQPLKQYDGEFRKGAWEGQGTMAFWDGRIFTGEWKKEIHVTKGQAPAQTGIKAPAEYRWIKRFAVGTLTYPDGRKEQGTLKMDGTFTPDKG